MSLRKESVRECSLALRKESIRECSLVFYCRTLCEAVKDFIVRAAEVSVGQGDEQFGDKCQALRDKLDLLLHTLQFEETDSLQQEELQQVVSSFPLFLWCADLM